MNTGIDACNPAIPADEAGAILTIDLDALTANWRFLRDKAGRAECAAVVKADAYGLGIGQTVPALAASGCKTFFVAHLSEATRVRKIAPQAVIYVLNGLFPGTGPTYAEHDLRPVLCSMKQIADWAGTCSQRGKKLPAAVQIDTGMARLGLSAPETLELAKEPQRHFDLCLLMSHFVASEEPDNSTNQKQMDLFDTARRMFPAVLASLANSAGILLPQAPHCDLVRPGYALYGGNPCPGAANPMRPVIRLEAPIVQIQTVPPGTSVGYNGRWTAKRESRLATISVGYADGYPRAASGTAKKHGNGSPMGQALLDSVLCPFVGTVSMDLIIIDITDAGPVKPGSLITLIGDALTIDRVGENAGTIGYEILTNLGRRYARNYIGGIS